MPATKFIGEILEATNKLKSKADTFDYLRRNNSPALEMIFFIAFSGKVKWALPEGTPPYKVNMDHYGSHARNLIVESGRLQQFIQCKAMIPNGNRREQAFISMLECLHKTEAEVVIALKDGTFDKMFRWIDPEMAHNLYPLRIPKPDAVIPLVSSGAGGTQQSPVIIVNNDEKNGIGGPVKRGRGRPRGTTNGNKTITHV